jgi:hypothetical protein
VDSLQQWERRTEVRRQMKRNLEVKRVRGWEGKIRS